MSKFMRKDIVDLRLSGFPGSCANFNFKIRDKIDSKEERRCQVLCIHGRVRRLGRSPGQATALSRSGTSGILVAYHVSLPPELPKSQVSA